MIKASTAALPWACMFFTFSSAVGYAPLAHHTTIFHPNTRFNPLAQVDLPGIIHAVDPSSAAGAAAPGAPAGAGAAAPDYPGLVRGLVRSYAERPSAILVAVVTCKEDLDTQVGGWVGRWQAPGAPGVHCPWLVVCAGLQGWAMWPRSGSSSQLDSALAFHLPPSTEQGVLALAREVDPQGVRTLGVLTKPDMVGGWPDDQMLLMLVRVTHACPSTCMAS